MKENFYSEIGKIGAKTNKENALKRYYENPNLCKNCNGIIKVKENEIPSITRQRKFCCKDCQSEYQSKKMLGNKYNYKNKISHCVTCGKELSNRQTKYCCTECKLQNEYESYIKRWKDGLEDGLKGEYQLSNYVQRYIKEKYNHKCSVCGWDKINPTTGKSPLEIHHKDGDYSNNDEDNLELLCPNCHSLTDTYKNSSGSNHSGRKKRSKYYDKKEILAS